MNRPAIASTAFGLAGSSWRELERVRVCGPGPPARRRPWIGLDRADDRVVVAEVPGIHRRRAKVLGVRLAGSLEHGPRNARVLERAREPVRPRAGRGRLRLPPARRAAADLVEHSLDQSEAAIAEPVQAIEVGRLGEPDVPCGRLVDDTQNQPLPHRRGIPTRRLIEDPRRRGPIDRQVEPFLHISLDAHTNRGERGPHVGHLLDQRNRDALGRDRGEIARAAGVLERRVRIDQQAHPPTHEVLGELALLADQLVADDVRVLQ